MVKRAVWRAVRAGRVFPKDPADFLTVAVDYNPTVSFFFIRSEEIYSDSDELYCFWSGVSAVPNLHSVHSVKTCGSLVSDGITG